MMNFKIIQLLLSMLMFSKLSFVSPQSQSCYSSHEGGTVSVKCSSGLIITAVNFASYGTPPFGTCGAYNTSSCHAQSSYSIVANACVNQSSCSIDANSKVFGDPCEETLKGLYVQVTCGELKPPIVSIHLNSPTANPSLSTTTDKSTATSSTLSTRMITNDDFIQAAQVGDLTRLKELMGHYGHFDIVQFLVTQGADVNAHADVSSE
jgi:hypothetical protein